MNPNTTLTFDKGTLLLAGNHPLTGDSSLKWVFDKRVGSFRTEAIYYSQVTLTAHLSGKPIEDHVPAWGSIQWFQSQIVPLRQHQLEAVEAWLSSRRGIIVKPTGTGKTEVALEIMRRVSGATLIVAPVRDLMYQWHRRIKKAFGYDAGVLGDNRFNIRPVTVTTYDSAYIHMPDLGNRFQLIIFDECHHLPGRTISEAARMCAAPYRLGLTATPELPIERRLLMEELIGPICFEMPLSEAKGRVLAECDIIKIPVYLSEPEQTEYEQLGRVVREHFSSRCKEDPDFTWQSLYSEQSSDPGARHALAAHRKRKSIEDRAAEKLRVIEDLFRLHKDTPTIVFTGSNVMARQVSLKFLVPCLLQHCGKAERADILSGFEERRYPVIVANQVLDEGVDLPAAKVAIVLGGMASTRQAKQRLGRILRKFGDERATLYEVVCQDTGDVARSRQRRKTDAYKGTHHRRN